MAELLVAKRTVPWEYRASRTELPRKVEVVVFDNRGYVNRDGEVSPNQLPVYWLPGYGQDRGKRLATTISWLAEQGVPAVGIRHPFNKVPRMRETVLDVARQVLPAIVKVDQHESSVPEGTKATILAQSQGAAIGTVLMGGPEGTGENVVVGRSVLLQPVGMRTQASIDGRSSASLQWEFVKHFGREGFKQPQRELATVTGVGSSIRQVLADGANLHWASKVGTAVSLTNQDNVVRHVNKGEDVAMIFGQNDGVSQVQEVTAALREVGDYREGSIPIIIIPGISHTVPNNSYGKRILTEALPYVR